MEKYLVRCLNLYLDKGCRALVFVGQRQNVWALQQQLQRSNTLKQEVSVRAWARRCDPAWLQQVLADCGDVACCCGHTRLLKATACFCILMSCKSCATDQLSPYLNKIHHV
jgi:hypothetical protein